MWRGNHCPKVPDHDDLLLLIALPSSWLVGFVIVGGCYGTVVAVPVVKVRKEADEGVVLVRRRKTVGRLCCVVGDNDDESFPTCEQPDDDDTNAKNLEANRKVNLYSVTSQIQFLVSRCHLHP